MATTVQCAAAKVRGGDAVESLRWLAVVLVGVTGNASAIIKPVLVGTYVRYFGLSARAAGYLLGAEMTAAALAVLISSVLLAGLPQRRFVAIGMVLVLAGNIGSMLTTLPTVLFLWRPVTGLGHGLMLGPVGAAIARVRQPDRLGGLMSIATMGTASALSFLVPSLQVELGGLGLFVAMAATIPLAAIGLRWFPELEVTKEGARVDLPKMPSWRVTTLASVGCLLWYLVVGGYWPYVEQFARAAGINYATATRILGWATLISMCGASLPVLLGDRLGRARILTVLFAIQGGGVLLMLFQGTHTWAYATSASLFVFSWIAIFPYLLGLMSEIDPGGRLNGLLYTMALIGYAVGPAAAGYLVGWAPTVGEGLFNVQRIELVLLVVSASMLLTLAIRRGRGTYRNALAT